MAYTVKPTFFCPPAGTNPITQDSVQVVVQCPPQESNDDAVKSFQNVLFFARNSKGKVDLKKAAPVEYEGHYVKHKVI
jgi:hypothetical protein